jgi:proteasome accessory factor B
MTESSPNKSERLINLTMALLATKRFLTKNQIFESVDGYEGSPETKERMFERDKTELRALGLEIEVGSEDPLFDDDAGYRINPKNYSLDLGEIEPQDLSLLSLAANQWQNSLFSHNAQSALRKIEAIHGAIEREPLEVTFHHREVSEDRFDEIWMATKDHREIAFDYRSLTLTRRHVLPYALFLLRGRWYLVGLDQEKKELRQFKVARIGSENLEVGRIFTRPSDFNLQEFLQGGSRQDELLTVDILVRKGRAQGVRALSPAREFDADWDLVQVENLSQSEIFELVAQASDSAKILSPKNLQESFHSWIASKRNG